ncbi:MAG: lytic transglycosylase domain-containing protein [Clostridia bacterium]|nr:lytic transglycosylase domain-containing protein [Clostridia bacterium]
MKTFKRCLSVLLILILAISVGLISNRIWLAIEEATHPTPYRETVVRYSLEYGVPESIIYAVMKTESGFDPNALSRKEARGLMQMLEGTFEDVNGYLHEDHTFDDLITPEISIQYGVYYLRYLYDMFGNWRNVIAAYNGGLGRVKKWLSDPACSDENGNLIYIPDPFDETRSYVFKVERAADVYQKLYFSNEKGVIS